MTFAELKAQMIERAEIELRDHGATDEEVSTFLAGYRASLDASEERARAMIDRLNVDRAAVSLALQ
jgi:hypothetical protein